MHQPFLNDRGRVGNEGAAPHFILVLPSYRILNFMRKEHKHHQILHNTHALIEQLKVHERIHPKTMIHLIQKASLIIKNEPNVLRLTSPLTVVGDIHGQFYDLVNMFSLFGEVPRRQFLFLGDFIDRGTFSIEVITLLLALKVRHPQSIHLIRGNHQSRCMTTAFNFRQECTLKYDEKMYDSVMRLFDELPLCAVIDGKYFAVHAGISPFCQTLEQIQQLNRFQQVPEEGGLCDLLWSDPSEQPSTKWEQNTTRRCSYFFSPSQTKSFLTRNALKMVIRGHEAVQEGFRYQTALNVPLTLTIFSAPNYSNHNLASVAEITAETLQVRTFTSVQHPFTLPNFQNLFQWSMPFVANCAHHLFSHLLKMSPIKDKLIHDIIHSRETFHQDYENLRKVMLIDKVLSLQEERPEQVYPKKEETKEHIALEEGEKGGTVGARVIGPNLRGKMVKIGSISAEEEIAICSQP